MSGSEDPAPRIRRYDPGDRNAVWQVHDRAFGHAHLDHDPELDRHLRHVEARFLDEGGEFLVAVVDVPPADPAEYGHDGERVVGFGGFLPSTCDTSSVRPTSPVDADPETAEVKSLRVDPAFQRRGAARSLMRELESRAADRGFERAVLDTGEGLTAAQSLYASLGYDRAGTESLRGYELIYYEREL